MDKDDIKSLLKSKGVLGETNKRKHCWKKYWDDECSNIFASYSISYRNEDEAWFCLLHNIEPPKCPLCGNLCKFTGRIKSGNTGYNTVCENCSANSLENKRTIISETKKSFSEDKKQEIIKKRKQTKLKLYGDENYMCYGSTSFRNYMLEKYGNEYYSNREKMYETNLQRYGVLYNFQIPGFANKSIEKKIELYGNASNYNKTKQTNLQRYGVEHISQDINTQNKSIKKKRLKISKIEKDNNCTLQSKIYKKYGQGWKNLHLDRIIINNNIYIDNTYIPLIEKYINEGTHTNNYTSNKEKQLVEYIKSIYSGPILENVTNIVKTTHNRFYELDIFLPELNIAFDFNGVYWHSDKFKDKYYHQRKTKQCYEAGIILVHIYEHIWDSDENIRNNIKSIIENQNDILKYNLIPVYLYKEYDLTEPELMEVSLFKIYNEGKFIKKTI